MAEGKISNFNRQINEILKVERSNEFGIFYKNPIDIFKEKKVNILIESVGLSDGISKRVVELALKNKINVITPNKALIAKHGDYLSKIAEKNNVNLEFEASVAGGIPILKAIKESYPHSNISIVSSNTNSVLCKEAPFINKYYIFDRNFDFLSKIRFILKFKKVSYDYIFNFSQDIETFFLLLTGKSKYKSNLIYLSRYGNPIFSKIFQNLKSS